MLRTARSEAPGPLRGMRMSFAHGEFFRGLTFDMSGGRKQAKPAWARPLDGRVRPRFGRDEAERGGCEYDRPSIAAARHLRLGFGVGPQHE